MRLTAFLEGIIMGRTLLALTLAASIATVACGPSQPAEAPEVAGAIRQSLENAGLDDVTVDQDRQQGVVTLGGEVHTDAEKARAESLARAAAPNQVVANEVAVRPQGAEDIADAVDGNIDDAIESNLEAVLVERGLDDAVDYEVTTGVVTLSGDVRTQAIRADIEKTAAAVPHVKQVVNNLQVRNQPASSSQGGGD